MAMPTLDTQVRREPMKNLKHDNCYEELSVGSRQAIFSGIKQLFEIAKF